MSRKKRDEMRASAFDAPSDLQSVADEIYGSSGPVLDTGVIRAQPVEIDRVRPDLTQPRRAIPLAVRGSWDGNVDDLPALLRHWQDEVERAAGQRVSARDVFAGRVELRGDEELSPVVDDYYDLLSLAASIYRDGLANPITVTRDGVIETGERRWLAHWLIALETQDVKWWKVPAIRIDRADVWRQAAENGARKPLNAISVARQLALLLMDMYSGSDGVRFDSYETLVLPGESDRRFYAQVANAKIFSIKRGMGQKVLDVTGLKSKKQIADYRALLEISDSLWMQADLENWSEYAIRKALDELQGTNRAGQNTPRTGDRLPTGNLQPEKGPETPYRTSIGERMGLYSGGDVSPLTDSQNGAEIERDWLTDDTWTEDDEREYVEIQAREAAIRAAQNQPIESVEPILSDEQALKILRALNLIGKAAGNVAVEKRAIEMSKLSLEQTRRAVLIGNGVDVWVGYLEETRSRMRGALELSAVQVDQMIDELIRAAREMADKHKP